MLHFDFFWLSFFLILDSFRVPEYKSIFIELGIYNFGTGGAWNDHDTVCPIAFQNQKQWWVYKDTSKGNLNPNQYHDFGVRCVDNDDVLIEINLLWQVMSLNQ